MTNPRTIQPDARKVIVGVDTHKHVHVAVAIDTWGIRLGDRSCAADSDGYQQLITWAERHGRVAAFGIEGTGSYGAGLARADRIVLDMDSSESPVHGAQEGSAYNGHFESVCYHPLFLFNDQGDCLAASLRPGNVPSADDWDDLLMPEIDRQQGAGRRVAFRADAAFARPAIYEALEQRDVD